MVTIAVFAKGAATVMLVSVHADLIDCKCFYVVVVDTFAPYNTVVCFAIIDI